MSHAALVDDGLSGIVAFLTLLLVMFQFAVTAPPPEPRRLLRSAYVRIDTQVVRGSDVGSPRLRRTGRSRGANGDPDGSPSRPFRPVGGQCLDRSRDEVPASRWILVVAVAHTVSLSSGARAAWKRG
jgi:hypothetical protein